MLLVDAPLSDAPVVSCRTITVIEVHSEATTSQAFAQAKGGDTIQIKGGSLGCSWKIPPVVTLIGCARAQIAGYVVFVGSGGTVEGFEVPGRSSPTGPARTPSARTASPATARPTA